jgi:hypothetical protein
MTGHSINTLYREEQKEYKIMRITSKWPLDIDSSAIGSLHEG